MLRLVPVLNNVGCFLGEVLFAGKARCVFVLFSQIFFFEVDLVHLLSFSLSFMIGISCLHPCQSFPCLSRDPLIIMYRLSFLSLNVMKHIFYMLGSFECL
jgi:hypothetical protein